MMETEKETLMERYKRMQLKHVNEFNLAMRKMKGIEEELARRDERIRALEQKFLGLYSSQPTKDNKKFRMIEQNHISSYISKYEYIFNLGMPSKLLRGMPLNIKRILIVGIE